MEKTFPKWLPVMAGNVCIILPNTFQNVTNGVVLKNIKIWLHDRSINESSSLDELMLNCLRRDLQMDFWSIGFLPLALAFREPHILTLIKSYKNLDVGTNEDKLTFSNTRLTPLTSFCGWAPHCPQPMGWELLLYSIIFLWLSTAVDLKCSLITSCLYMYTYIKNV